MKKWIPGLMIFFLLMTPVAADVGYYCVDGNSFHNWTIDGDIHSITEPCKFDCINATGVCQDEPLDMGFSVAVIMGYIGVAFIMAYLAMNVDREKHGAIQILFIFLSLYGVWATLGMTGAILEAQGILTFQPLNTAYITIQLWATVFVLGYLFIMMIWNLYQYLIKLKGRRKDGLQPTSEAGVGF